jgi:hypothetical protein
VVVYFAIKLDREPERRTIEIEHEAAERVLSSEVQAVQLIPPECSPEDRLSRRFFASKAACRLLNFHAARPHPLRTHSPFFCRY